MKLISSGLWENHFERDLEIFAKGNYSNVRVWGDLNSINLNVKKVNGQFPLIRDRNEFETRRAENLRELMK